MWVASRAKQIQRELFRVGSALATPPQSAKPVPEIGNDMVDALTADVERIEATEGVLSDWSIPGEDAASAAFDVARTVCRRSILSLVSLNRVG